MGQDPLELDTYYAIRCLDRGRNRAELGFRYLPQRQDNIPMLDTYGRTSAGQVEKQFQAEAASISLSGSV